MFRHDGSKGMRMVKGLGIAVLAAGVAAALGLVVMTLWNGLLPGLFGFKTLHFWQALGLLVLTRILFGGFHRGHGHGFHRRHHMIQRWESMTPEEREKFRSGFRHGFPRCGRSGQADQA